MLTDNPLADFVELPEEYRELKYCNVLAGVVRGALEMVGTRAGPGARAREQGMVSIAIREMQTWVAEKAGRRAHWGQRARHARNRCRQERSFMGGGAGTHMLQALREREGGNV